MVVYMDPLGIILYGWLSKLWSLFSIILTTTHYINEGAPKPHAKYEGAYVSVVCCLNFLLYRTLTMGQVQEKAAL